MLRTFNCGIGMVLVVAAADAPRVVEMLKAEGETPCTLGVLEAASEAEAQVEVVGGAAAWGW